jgi:hypothetical protein
MNRIAQEEAEAAQAKKEEEVLGRLKKLGVQVNEDDLFVDVDEGKAPLVVADDEDDVEKKAEIAMLQAYERLWNTCLGVHTMDFVAGNTRITAKMTGFDVMELMPPPPSILKAKKDQLDQLEAVRMKYGKKRRSADTDGPQI